MQTFEIAPGHFFDRSERRRSRCARPEIKAYVRSGPTREGTSQYFYSEAGEGESGEVSGDFPSLAQFGNHWRGILGLTDELNPFARLKNGSVRESVENTPVNRVKFDDVALHPLFDSIVVSPLLIDKTGRVVNHETRQRRVDLCPLLEIIVIAINEPHPSYRRRMLCMWTVIIRESIA